MISHFLQIAFSHYLTGLFWGLGFLTPIAIWHVARWSVSRLLPRNRYGR